jgi:hypothetical protein
MPHSRRSLLAGFVALTAVAALPLPVVAARPTITVYKDPT